MRLFATLFDALDTTNSTLAKVDALVTYFTQAPPEDSAWALYFLSGRKMNRLLPTKQLVEAALQATSVPAWLFDESYSTVGDLGETIACLLESHPSTSSLPLHDWIEGRLTSLRGAKPAVQQEKLISWWSELNTREIFLMNKLVTGSFRAGVSHNLVVRALAKIAGVAEPFMAHRLMGNWEPSATFFTRLIQTESSVQDPGTPYPFYLASPLEAEIETLGDPSEWLMEWKWDGIRAQCVRREGTVYLWSRGEELITDRFPEISAAAKLLPPGTVLDGEILAFRDDQALLFSALQQRIGRKKLTPKVLSDVPVAFMVFDLLEDGGRDIREEPLSERRRRLEAILAELPPVFRISQHHEVSSWEALSKIREQSRDNKVEGLMLKRLSSPYKSGRKRGDWWKWKVAPYTLDAVLLYAQAGHGRRATLFTDYTFGIWKGEDLVPIAKAYSGLTDAEIGVLDRWIRANTLERFGPVRSVPPTLVFELAFEAIALSARHKSGIAVRFPRILRQRTDKQAKDADTIERVRELLSAR